MIPKHVVLDTNVCLDLFVFRDPRWRVLLEAMEDGSVVAVTRADCRDEWLAVLQYRHLPLEEDSRARAAGEFDRLVRVVEAPAPSSAPAALPVCSDGDDQKFMEVARDAGAGVLITKDKALLKLARRTARAGLFRILTPEAWLAEMQQATMADPASG